MLQDSITLGKLLIDCGERKLCGFKSSYERSISGDSIAGDYFDDVMIQLLYKEPHNLAVSKWK